MAILNSIPGIIVTVHDADNDDTALREYEAPYLGEDKIDRPIYNSTTTTTAASHSGLRVSQRKRQKISNSTRNNVTVTKYIESLTNSPFRICWTFLPPLPDAFIEHYDILAKVFIDGTLVEDRIFESAELRVEDEGPEGWRHFMAGTSRLAKDGKAWVEKPFVFQWLDIDHDDWDCAAREAAQETHKHVGLIRVEMFRVKDGGDAKGSNRHWADVREIGKVPEKAMKGKGVNHGVGVGTERQRQTGSVRVGKVSEVDVDAFARFDFHYRSMENLKKMGVVERTPIPEPFELKDPKLLTNEEKETLIERARENFIKQHRARKAHSQSGEVVPEQDQDSDNDIIIVMERRICTKKSNVTVIPKQTKATQQPAAVTRPAAASKQSSTRKRPSAAKPATKARPTAKHKERPTAKPRVTRKRKIEAREHTASPSHAGSETNPSPHATMHQGAPYSLNTDEYEIPDYLIDPFLLRVSAKNGD